MAAAGALGYLAAVPTTSTKLFARVCHLTFDVSRLSQISALILCVSLLDAMTTFYSIFLWRILEPILTWTNVQGPVPIFAGPVPEIIDLSDLHSVHGGMFHRIARSIVIWCPVICKHSEKNELNVLTFRPQVHVSNFCILGTQIDQMLVVRDVNISIVVWCCLNFKYPEKINPGLVDVMCWHVVHRFT